jgi:hypothetical protein
MINGLKWSENMIAMALATQVFERKHLVIVPRCGWPGSECDLLVVTRDLRIIDVEIKISRADLKADAKKDKWFHHWDFKIDGPWQGWDAPRRPRQWPQRVWKHYYCMPRDIWAPELVEFVPAASGILLVTDWREYPDRPFIRVERQAKPCRDAERITAEDAVDIARLASLRMWEALRKIEKPAKGGVTVTA